MTNWKKFQAKTAIATVILMISKFTTANFMGSGRTEEYIFQKNREFADCKCVQKLRTSYFSTHVCGKAALCYWEIWNYKATKNRIKEIDYDDEECDEYMVQKYACLIGYPKPQDHDPECDTGLQQCETDLAKLLYDDCESIRTSRNLPAPEDLDPEVRLEGLNYGLLQDKDTIFKPRPSSNHPVSNNYYALSCPIIYRHPYFTIDLLLKELDPTIEYDETMSLVEVGQMLPRILRDGINNERIQNFEALALEENMIHWCGIPRNYVCVREERDKHGTVCGAANLDTKKAKCDGPPPPGSP